MPESVLHWGIAFILSLQNLGDWLISPMNAFTFLGNEDFFLLLFPFLYWCVETYLGVRIGIYLVVSIGLNNLLKTSFHAPRPYWLDQQVKLLTGAESSFGIPSGHAQNGVVIWGGIATQVRRGWAWGIALALVFLIGFSRIYLGVHFPTDVLGGWLLGIVVLLFGVWLEKPILDGIQKFSVWQKIGIFFAISIALILLQALVIQVVNNSFVIPAVWVQNALQAAPDDPMTPLSLGGMVTIMAAAFGFVSGVVWLGPRGGFDVSGTWLIRAARFVVGITGVMALRYGLDFLFGLIAPDESAMGFVLRYLRYSTIGFWMSALAPLVFIWLKLAKKAG